MNGAIWFEAGLLFWCLLCAVVFLTLFFITAPYGRHRRKGWGPEIPTRWCWVFMELPAVLVMGGCFIFSERVANPVCIIFISMWEMHYIHRTFIYPFRMRHGGQSTPLLIASLAIVTNIMVGLINGYWLFHLAPLQSMEWLFDPRFVLGIALFGMGFLINYRSDRILLNLRKPGETGYRIPFGGGYRWVSSPNYMGEIIEWLGWALATWSGSGLMFAMWTISNLLPRAKAHHQWYREKFADYPGERKALIPWIY